MTTLLHHDYPYKGRPHRYYIAITTDCNRACPWCSTYSRPGKKTYLSKESFINILPKDGIFEVQFEGGEPTLHPDLLWMTRKCRQTRRCHRIILCTNGVLFPFKYKNKEIAIKASKSRLKEYFPKFGYPLTIKLSLNHHLFECDKLIFKKAKLVVDVIEELIPTDEFKIILNVRRRNNPRFDYDNLILEQLSHYDLKEYSNIFFLQSYGRNKNNPQSQKPFLVGYNFTLYNPDSRSYGTDLISRSEAMKTLP